jgi:hypothetical protein
MLELFSTLWRRVQARRARKPGAGTSDPGPESDLLAHTVIAAMGERELADLPFPRGTDADRGPPLAVRRCAVA